jgi:hypothetical protein
MVIKAGFCVAYDWKLLELSLPVIYSKVDQICLSVDRDRLSWNGNSFFIDEDSFLGFIRALDTEKKIILLEESFYDAQRQPIYNECYQRRRMAEVLGEADWILQIDTDEIFLNIDDFISFLSHYNKLKRPVNIHGVWINLIKQTRSGFIYSILPTPPLATNKAAYEYGRTNGHFNVYTNTFLAHITWARDNEEVRFKLENWGHSTEFNGVSFYRIWEALDDFNWRYIKDFHPMNKRPIPSLYFQPAKDFNEFKGSINFERHFLKRTQLLKNNIWISRGRKLIKLLIGKK